MKNARKAGIGIVNTSTCNIIVFGDIMLDKYYKGNVSRISPEAPVPVITMESETYVLGGAANVANNVKKLGANVQISGCIGYDNDGDQLLTLLQNNSINTDLLIRSHSVNTISKSRIIGNSQQIVRLDFNDSLTMSADDLNTILEKFKTCASSFDIIVISDYNKGFLTKDFCESLIKISKSYKKTIIVDPKGIEWCKYSGASIITPNFQEIKKYLKLNLNNTDQDIEQSCKSLKAELDIDNLLITRSEQGMTLIKADNTYIHFAAEAKEVFDVSGAGDTVVATLAVCLGLKNSLISSIQLANKAGGIVVGKSGTSTITMDELEGKLSPSSIYSIDDIYKLVSLWRKEGKTIAFTNGCFDLLHRGHIYSLISAASFADKLIVAINSDSSVKALKGPERPINSEFDRAYMIAALACVDAVTIFSDATPIEIIKNIQPDVLVKGNDYKAEDVAGHEYSKRVEIIENIPDYSTTKLISNMKKTTDRMGFHLC